VRRVVLLALAAGAAAGAWWWAQSRIPPVIPALGKASVPAEAAGLRPEILEEAGPSPARLVEIASGFERPLFLTHAGDRSGRLFVVEQGGTVRILRGGRVLDEPFLDLSPRLDNSSGERGLLGLAFAPDFAASGVFYVQHTAPGPAVVVARMRAPSPGADRADPDSWEAVLSMADPASNHNGGMLAFGPDGDLWIGTGDGGRAADPWDNARDLDSLLGKMLRIDVSGARTGERGYGIPDGNPFLGRRGARPELWAVGLRNPWRYSFDRETGELWIGDVGQNAWEEIDVEDPREGGGRHYGWRTMEGLHCFDPATDCSAEGLTLPIHEYGHDRGCSVTGGYVYRGAAIPELRGAYLYSDYCAGTVWRLDRDPAGPARVSVLLESGASVSSFGEGPEGELYLCDHGGGRILKLVPAGT